MTKIHWATITAIGSSLIAAGCTALDPQPENTRFFTLSTSTPAEVRSTESSTQVQIRLNRISEYLETTHMVVRVTPNELRFTEKHRWAEALQDSFVRVAADALRKDLPDDVSVRVVPIRTAGPEMITIDINLLACEGEMPGTAVLAADWQIWEGTAGSPSSSGHFRQTSEAWNPSDFDQLAGMLGALTEKFADALTKAVLPAIERAEKEPGGS
jgi:uncharacterized lipoprotein YmbA